MGGQPKGRPGTKSYRDGTKKGAQAAADKHRAVSMLGKQAKTATGPGKKIVQDMLAKAKKKRSY